MLSIEYTGNASLSPYNKVDFSYVTITDPQKSYVGGSLVTNRVALDKIIVKADNSIVKEYHFKYTYDQGTRLSEIIEKDFAGNQFNSTIIDWGKSQISVAKRDADPFINGSFCFYYGDFNGDGRMDRVDDVYENMTYSLKLFHYSGQQNLFNHIATYNNQPSTRYEVVDINRDGKDDLIEIIPTSGNSYNYKILLSNGNGFNYMNLFNSGSLFSNTGGPHEMGIGDFDGDGVIDILFIKIDLNQNKLWEIFSFDANNSTGLEKRYAGNNFPNKPGEECTYSAAGGQYKKVCHPIYSLVNHVLFDYNGDGKTDILYFDKNGVARVLEFSLTGFTDVLFTSNLKEEEFKFFSDVNSDGLIDLVSKNDIYLSTGKGFVKCNDLVAEEKGDFNGDGKIDGIYIANENGVYNYYIKYNLGSSFSEPVKIASDVNSCGILKVADFNGDGIDDVFYWTSNPLRTGILYISNTNKNQFVSSITDGFNNTTFFEYKPLSDNSVYTKESGSLFPFMDYVGPFYVVSQMKVNNGIGGYNTFRYKYSGLRTHLQGRGSLGFKKTSIENLDNQTIVENVFDIQSKFVFPYLKQREIKLTSGNLIVRTDYSMSLKELGGKRFFPYLSQQITSNYLNNTSDNTTYKYDDNGNVLEAFTDHSGEGTTKITTTYTNGGSWLPSKPLKITVVKSVSGDVAFTQITDFTYNSFGRVLTQSNGTGTGKIVTTSFQYNSFGLPTRVTVSGTDVAGSRSVDYEYDTKGRFQIKSTNALGHISSATFDNKTGNILTSTDINGFITRFEYDGFGRCLRTILPDGNIVLNTLNWSDSSAPQHAVYCQTTQSTSAPAEKIYYDRLGRELQKVNVGFNGDNIYSEVRYNSKKQIEWEIEPHYTNTIDKITRNYSYDQFGRINFISGPLEVKKITYNGRTVISSKENTSPKQTFSQTFNAFGQVVSVTDAGGTINYIYNSQGKVKKVISPGNLITLMEYDSFGNQIKISEPNAGTIDYTYNAFGELLTQIKNGNTSSITYDAIGRVLTLTEQEGTTNYTYDTRTKGKGKVSSILHSSGTGENYYYDVLGRLSSKTEVIEGKQYTESIQYNSYGLPSSLTYPSGFCVAYNYNSNFYLTEVTRADNNTSIWKAEKMNPIGQLEQFRLGNNLTTKQVYNFGFLTGIQTGSIQNLSYEWDRPTGNLKMRKDVKRGLTERFNYDQLDRLTRAAIEGGFEMNFTYENNGNISYNSGAGNYVYDPIKVNAVTEIANPQGTISTTDQTAEYTTFDKIKKLTEGSKSAIISYGVNKERIKMTFTEGPTTKNRIYTHGNYEEESGVVERKIHYIATGSGVSALFIITNSGGTMYYLHKDHLGSIDVITNAVGEIVEEQSFDVWGRRRNPNNWTYENIASSSLIDRGYTGHEHLDQFGIINMNGRIYDPGIGRFLSPDKYVQAPQFTQSFNRFSYCFNNPLKYTDPSGWTGENTTSGMGEYGQFDHYGRPRYDPLTGLFIPAHERQGGVHAQGYGDQRYYGSYVTRNVDVWWVSGSGYVNKKTGVYNELVRHYQSGTVIERVWVWDPQRAQGQGGITVPYILGGMENSAQALRHYFNGNGTPVTLGNNTISALVLSDEFQRRHQRIISGKTTSLTGNFSVNLRGTVFHVGSTNVDYSITCANGNCTVTYDMFVRDGFWDPDYIDEYIMGKLFGEPLFQPDGPGPNLERFGGTPYPYNPVRGTYTFPNPGY